MAIASDSAWSKPGSWALDAESHESEPASVMDFPTLATAAATKAPKKKKPQTLSLAEFTTGSSNLKPASTHLTHDEMLALPMGPRERSAEELERPRGFGYTSYNSGGSNRNREESGNGRSGSDPRDNGPSRADEVDDWGKTKKSVVLERRGGGGGVFFDSNPSRADDANSWVSNKRETAPVQSDSRRSASSNWGFNKERDVSSDTWGRKREEAGSTNSSGTRPRLVLQPRTLPLATASHDSGSSGGITPQSEV
jgi:Plant specific eukaryotic initiation factor 4B